MSLSASQFSLSLLFFQPFTLAFSCNAVCCCKTSSSPSIPFVFGTNIQIVTIETFLPACLCSGIPFCGKQQQRTTVASVCVAKKHTRQLRFNYMRTTQQVRVAHSELYRFSRKEAADSRKRIERTRPLLLSCLSLLSSRRHDERKTSHQADRA